MARRDMNQATRKLDEEDLKAALVENLSPESLTAIRAFLEAADCLASQPPESAKDDWRRAMAGLEWFRQIVAEAIGDEGKYGILLEKIGL
jgi:hypothetical protein